MIVLLRTLVIVPVLFGGGIRIQAQDDGSDADFTIERDAKTGHSGIVDANGSTLWPAEFAHLRPAGKKLAVGFKPGDPDAWILGTGGRVKRVPAEDYWRAYRTALLKSDIADRPLIVRVLDLQADPFKRQDELNNLEQTYTGMAHVRSEAVAHILGTD